MDEIPQASIVSRRAKYIGSHQKSILEFLAINGGSASYSQIYEYVYQAALLDGTLLDISADLLLAEEGKIDQIDKEEVVDRLLNFIGKIENYIIEEDADSKLHNMLQIGNMTLDKQVYNWKSTAVRFNNYLKLGRLDRLTDLLGKYKNSGSEKNQSDFKSDVYFVSLEATRIAETVDGYMREFRSVRATGQALNEERRGLANRLGATLRRSIRTLKSRGLVTERTDTDGSQYVISQIGFDLLATK